MSVSLLSAGCSSVNYTSKGVYLGALHETELDMLAIGFMPVATSHETINNAFNDDWRNDWITYDTRQFADSLGNTAAYTVAYRIHEDGMRTIAVAGCEVSHPGDYALVCGDNGIVQRMNNIPSDQKSRDFGAMIAKTLIGSGILIPTLLVLSIIL